MAGFPGGTVETTDRGVRVTSGVPFHLANWVLRTNCPDDGVDDHIASTLRHFRGLGLPFLWANAPGDRPAHLRERLLAAGFHESASPAMAADLDTLPKTPLAAGLSIRPVRSAEDIAVFARTLNAGDFQASGEIERAIPGLLRPSVGETVTELDFRCFIGYQDGAPVATSARLLSDGVVGIWGVATVPSARRRGFGAAMTVAALEDGRNLGYGVGVLLATQMGEPVYKRLGFRELYRLSEFSPPVESLRGPR
jgi:GNAT superfamily N-acetyltransferase